MPSNLDKEDIKEFREHSVQEEYMYPVSHPSFNYKIQSRSDVREILLDALAQCLDMNHEYDVEEFTKNNRIEKAKEIWEPEKEVHKGQLQPAIINTLKLAEKFNIPPTSRIFGSFTVNLPIIYYFFNSDYKSIDSIPEKELRKIEFFMYSAYMGDKYSRRYVNLAKPYQEAIKSASSFPIQELNEINQRVIGESILPSEPRIREAFNKTDIKKSALSFGLFRLLYYPLNFDEIHTLERDHIYPKEKYDHKKLQKHGYDEWEIDLLLEKQHSVSNSQLLTPDQNQEKGEENPNIWFDNKSERYFKKHYIPEKLEAEWSNMQEFFNKRQDLIINYILDTYNKEFLKKLDKLENK